MINLGELAPAILRGIVDSSAQIELESVFTKGEILQGKVVRLSGSQGSKGAVVSLRGIRLNALTQTPLTPGQSILVRVDQIKPQFMVSLLSNDTPIQEKTAALLRLYLPTAMEMGELFKNLEKILSTLTAAALKNSGIKDIFKEIERAMRNPSGKGRGLPSLLGFSHEAELLKGRPLENLKRSLLMIQRNLENLIVKDPFQYREVLKNVKELVQSIELRQLMNLSEGREVKSWEFPYWNGHDVSTARLYVKREKGKTRKAADGDAFRITLMLNMSRIGAVRFDAAVLKEKVEGLIYAENKKFAREIEDALPSLVESIEKLGYSAHFGVKVATKKFLAEELEDRKDLPVKGLLNVKA